MRIHGDTRSGNCLKIKWTADHLGLPYDWVDVDFMRGETRSEPFLHLNPMGQVPVVELDDGRPLAQSNAVILYLAENTPLLPDDRYLRAKVHELMFWEQYSHEPYIAVLRFQMLFQGRSREEREDWRVARGEAALDLMDRLLTGRDWFVGTQLSVADIALLAYTREADAGGFDLASRPQVRRWIARCEDALDLEHRVPATPATG